VQPTAAGNEGQLFSVQYTSSTIVYAIGESGDILKSTDAGATWVVLSPPTIRDLYGISFISPTTGWVAGSSGTILATTDGGSTWAPETSGTNVTLYAIHFKTSLIGWAAGTNGTILKTTNGGSTWTSQVSGTTQALYSINFASASVGWVVGAFGTILRTVNGGASWSLQPSGTVLSLFGVQFASFLNGWAVGSYGEILRSTNGGISWFEQASGTYNDLYTLNFTSATNGWAMGDLGTIMHTTDGGTTWQMQSNGVKVALNGIYFPSPALGYSVGDEGVIIKTTNGGMTWTQQASGFFYSLYGTYFINDLNGWCVGDSAVIFHTTNGGATWVSQHSRTDPTLYSIHFPPNSVSGWAVGDFGTILYSSNSGSQWVPQTSGTTTTLLGVKFVDSKKGWAVGYGGTIINTTNGGATWKQQASGTFQTLYALDVIDSNNIFISGDFGTILHTTDGGMSWTSLVTGSDVSLYSLDFYSPSYGWAVGDDGAIIGTTDGGTTWKTQNSMTTHTLWAVQVVKGTTGGIIFATGIGGTIVCSGISPLPVKTWTGGFDSLWTSGGNWNPLGVPLKLDSVYIPSTATSPVIKQLAQQLNIGALSIGSNAKLTIYGGLSEFIVKDNIAVNGQLVVDPSSNVEIVTGGDFFVGLSGSFSPGNSTVYMTSAGQLRGSFNNVILAESSTVHSVGSISIRKNFIALANLDLRPVDTLTIQNPDAAAFQGPGLIGAGTIKRALKPGSRETYRFESSATYLQFYPDGTMPDTVAMTVFPNTLPPGFQDSLFARRYYSITASGGSNYRTFLSLRYDTSETSIPIYNLSLFRDSSGVLFNMNSPDFLDSDIVAVYADSIRGFSSWYFGRSDYNPQQPYQFTDSLFLIDNGAIADTLFFGAAPGATDNIDAAFGETGLGAPPSPGTFDVRWLIPPSQGTITDIRNMINTDWAQNTYTARLQPGPGGYPFFARWNKDALCLGSFLLRDQSSHGGQFSLSMKLQNSYTITNSSITQIEIVHLPPVYYTANPGWNILSIPLTSTNDSRKIHVFPTAVSNAFGYNVGTGYFVADTLKNGRGYWVKYAGAQAVPIEGLPRTLDTISVSNGWNLIGSISNPVARTSILQFPSNIVISSYFGYSGSYFAADTISPSKGYWVKVNSSGKLLLNSSSAEPKLAAGELSTKEMLQDFNTITFTDRNGNSQTLYFGTNSRASFRTSLFEMPPTPPEELFDVRFGTGNMVELISQDRQMTGIDLQSAAYPVTVRWNFAQESMRSFSLRDAATGKVIGRSSATTNSIRIDGNGITKLSLQTEAEITIPKEFALKQNYPNPFNPTTTIAFDLPTPSVVTLKIFNILGQEMTTLAENREYVAGSHEVSLNATAFASGVYFYQLYARDAGNKEFRQVRKMLLMK
jgi:photosystem II stability/assembly factor-like uncharacterized protein